MSEAIRPAMMDDTVREYAEGIDPAHRPLFDRIHRLVASVRPEVTVAISYGIPTYRAGGRRLYVGAWKHGLSIYGWQQDGGFLARHPGLKTSKGTIRLRPEDATGIPDEEFRDFLRAALSG
jgi:uncharacterized protein YdhG (YjbR/CyaY superfamily)